MAITNKKELQKARLADIEVDEVSIVDKAANKRKWLFMKRDTSEEDKGGENLELLKAFSKDEDAIAALEGIEEHLTNFDALFNKKLEDESLTEEQKALLLEKRAQYEELKEMLEDGFEELFLGKTAFSSNGGANGKGNDTAKSNGSTGDEPSGVESEEEINTEEADGQGDSADKAGDPTSKGKGGKGAGNGLPMPLAGVKKKKKPADDEDMEDEEDDSDDEEAEGEAPAGKKKPTKKSEEDEAEEDDEELDEEEQGLMKQISAELERGTKLRKELKEQNAQQAAE